MRFCCAVHEQQDDGAGERREQSATTAEVAALLIGVVVLSYQLQRSAIKGSADFRPRPDLTPQDQVHAHEREHAEQHQEC